MAPFESVTLEVPEHSVLALCTDGLIEARDHDSLMPWVSFAQVRAAGCRGSTTPTGRRLGGCGTAGSDCAAAAPASTGVRRCRGRRSGGTW
ncbi:SpoIIE family protein phosphatase [Streptomyces sp. NPDC057909]|uniref:SpoIIE family protein phosphatase n=1 Tax=Streptomyces sp. NPDC057909 TaxID=3346277 RepID=UPI0036E1F641